MQRGKLGHGAAEAGDKVAFHAAHDFAKARAFGFQVAAGARKCGDLDINMLAECVDAGDEISGGFFHPACLGDDVITHKRAAHDHFLNGAVKLGGGILQACFQRAKGCLGNLDDLVEIVGALFQAVEDGAGFGADHIAGLLKGDTLVFESGDQIADALLIATESVFDGGHFTVNHAFKLACAAHGLFNTRDEGVHLFADGRGSGGEVFDADILRTHETHGRVHEAFGHLAQLLGAIKQIGGGHHCGTGHEHEGKGPHDIGHKNRGLAKHGGQIGRARQRHPENGNGASGIEGGHWRLALEIGNDGGGAGLVLIGGHVTQRHPSRIPQCIGFRGSGFR